MITFRNIKANDKVLFLDIQIGKDPKIIYRKGTAVTIYYDGAFEICYQNKDGTYSLKDFEDPTNDDYTISDGTFIGRKEGTNEDYTEYYFLILDNYEENTKIISDIMQTEYKCIYKFKIDILRNLEIIDEIMDYEKFL